MEKRSARVESTEIFFRCLAWTACDILIAFDRPILNKAVASVFDIRHMREDFPACVLPPALYSVFLLLLAVDSGLELDSYMVGCLPLHS